MSRYKYAELGKNQPEILDTENSRQRLDQSRAGKSKSNKYAQDIDQPQNYKDPKDAEEDDDDEDSRWGLKLTGKFMGYSRQEETPRDSA